MNKLIALQKVVELGSFSKATRALGYTQSAISQMILSFENELAIKLIHRSRNGAKLTPEGKKLFPYLTQVNYRYQLFIEKCNEVKGLESGVIRIGTISSITCYWLPQLIKDFQKKYPNVQFVFHQGDYTSIEEWIKIGAVDFGFIAPDAAREIETLPLKNGEMLAVLAENHPLATMNEIPLSLLSKEPFILLEEGHYSEPLNAFQKEGLEMNTTLTLHDDYAIMTMIEAGLGVSVLAELILQRMDFNIIARPTLPRITRTIGLGYKDRNSLPIASQYFIDFILDHVDSLK
ncbi:LysR family transcriptional regulator [Enterococcus hulanensis]|uniref:LysR family transcriptional regulator n=1 Tax=Enterococcus hulanensis TaxID=2559929 RepID=UPI001A8F74A0|nr:LysR family transcriptional regulator [Enterococcus hulanensis]MBO0458239.1 LysR family transcriptional regulator [Enterococcus hulanensis]